MNSSRIWLLVALFAALSVSKCDTTYGSTASSGAHLSPAWLVAPAEASSQAENRETRELVFKTINFVILVGALAYLLRKPLSDFFAQRTAEIEAGLEEGRKALAEAESRLKAVEEKLRRLEQDIADFKSAAQREMEAERQRMRDAAEAEAKKIVESARTRMETITRAARLDLKHFAAAEALKQAEELIRARLDASTHSGLVNRFLEGLGGKN